MLRNKKIAWIVFGVLFGVSIAVWLIIWDLREAGDLEVVFFDVGQGDAIFVETKYGFQVLIDGGPDLTILDKLGKEMPFYDRTLDLIVLTHPDHDHLFGLLEVLKRYEVKNILWTGVEKDTAEWQEWKKLIKEEGANIIIAKAGQRINFSAQGIFLDILYPFESLEGREFKYANDTSIVAELVFKNISVLFTGDISKKTEKELIDKYIDLKSDILKIAHHGSASSSCEEFLEKISPELAVISVGENSWGHPDKRVLANLEKFDIKVLITKELGDIKIISDGQKYQFSNF